MLPYLGVSVNFTPRPYHAVPRLRTSGVPAQVGVLPGNLYGGHCWRSAVNAPATTVRSPLARHTIPHQFL